MTRVQRTVLTLTALIVLMPISARVARSQSQDSNEAGGKTYIISGSAGLPGVQMKGLPGGVVTDENGRYSAKVPRGFTGTVTPTKEGFQFAPPAKIYSSVEKDYTNQNYAPSLITFTISGNAGIAGVVMKGLPGNPPADAKGNYVARVGFGWSGAVTPMREGYAFEPPQRMYNKVMHDLSNQDYRARMITYTISGHVGTQGVRMEGLPGRVVSAPPTGRYQGTVPYGWSGKVVPKKDGCAFEPASCVYESVKANHRSDYRARPDTVVISDIVGTDPGGPIEGVTLTALPGDTIATTDFQGRFVIRVPYGWSGQLKLVKEGYEFSDQLRYTNVTHHLIDGERTSAFEKPDIPAPRVSAMRPQPVLDAGVGEVLMIPASEVDPKALAQTREDMQVMLEILREKLSEPRTILGILYDYGDFFGGGRDAEALYLEGYGVLFLMRVDFPLSFDSAPPVEEKPVQEADPVWQRARQKLYAPRDRGRYGRAGASPAAADMTFEQFQDDLVEALRHAANIRHIDPNESVVLTIVGQDEKSGVPGYGGAGGFYSSSRGGSYSFAYGGSHSSAGDTYGGPGLYGGGSPSSRGAGRRRSQPRPGPIAPTAPTVLTIQAKKADVDAFAKGDTTLEQFQKHVKVFSY